MLHARPTFTWFRGTLWKASCTTGAVSSENVIYVPWVFRWCSVCTAFIVSCQTSIRCSECSNVLHAGGYKPGKNPDTFICSAHHNNCNPSSSEPGIKAVPVISAGRSCSASQTQPAPLPSSVLLAPVNIAAKPVSPAPPSRSWTASAQKTQSARQRFFQTAPSVTEVTTGNRKPSELTGLSGKPKISSSPDDEKSRARTTIGKKIAEENCNNNNKRPFTIRPAERRWVLHSLPVQFSNHWSYWSWSPWLSLCRFGGEPGSADGPSLRKDKCSQGPAGNWTVQPSTSQTNNKESPRLKAVNTDSTRPTTVHSPAKGKCHRICFSSSWICCWQPANNRPPPPPHCLRLSPNTVIENKAFLSFLPYLLSRCIKLIVK